MLLTQYFVNAQDEFIQRSFSMKKKKKTLHKQKRNSLNGG